MNKNWTIDDGTGEVPDALVASWELDRFPLPLQYVRMAGAYLDGAQLVFQGIAEDRLPLSFPHARVGQYLFLHALELFLKGVLLYATGGLVSGHDLGELYVRYRAARPDESLRMAGRLEDVLASDIGRPQTQQSRYPSDTQSKKWTVPAIVMIEQCIRDTSLCRTEFDRLSESLLGHEDRSRDPAGADSQSSSDRAERRDPQERRDI